MRPCLLQPPGRAPDADAAAQAAAEAEAEAEVEAEVEAAVAAAAEEEDPEAEATAAAQAQAAAETPAKLQRFTIVTGLLSVLKNRALRHPINEAVRDTTLVKYETLTLLGLYVTHYCKEARRRAAEGLEALPAMPYLGATFISHCIRLVTHSDEAPRWNQLPPDELLLSVYHHLYLPSRSNNLRRVNRDRRSEQLNSLAIQLAVNVQLHVRLNFQRFLRRWCSMRLYQDFGEHQPSPRGKVLDRMVNSICAEQCLNTDLPEGLSAAQRAWVQALVTSQRAAHTTLLPADTRELRRQWQKYLPWLHDMLLDIEAYNLQVRAGRAGRSLAGHLADWLGEWLAHLFAPYRFGDCYCIFAALSLTHDCPPFAPFSYLCALCHRLAPPINSSRRRHSRRRRRRSSSSSSRSAKPIRLKNARSRAAAAIAGGSSAKGNRSRSNAKSGRLL